MDTIILWVGLLHALMTFRYSLDTSARRLVLFYT